MNTDKAKIADLPLVLRPREKLLQYGPNKLSNSELLAIILNLGLPGENVIDLSKRLLQKFGSLNLPNKTCHDLRKEPGIGPAKAAKITACFELGRRLLKDKKTRILLSARDIWQALGDIHHYKKEHCFVFYLDNRNQEIKRDLVSVGTIDASVVHPREVFEPAIRNLAARIILAHNHPSGNPKPSLDDIELTRQLKQAGELLGIELYDHVIVAKHGYYSFREKWRSLK